MGGKTPGVGAEVFLKLENLQPCGSFKVRPASNAIACIQDKRSLMNAGVCTASAGNFAQGLAWCCREMGVSCTVVVPDTAPSIKVAAIQDWGATVIKVPYSEWWTVIESHECPQAPQGSVFIHPGAENACLAGNATIAREIFEDLPDVDCIVAPYGSGALVTGVACGIRALAENGNTSLSKCQVMAVEPATAAPFTLSMKAGHAVSFESWEPSFVDGCGGRGVLDEIWQLAKQVVTGGCAVPVMEVAATIKQLAEHNKIIVEGAGACPVAAALGGRCGPQPRKIVCIVSGGGLDSQDLITCLEGGLPGVKAKELQEKVQVPGVEAQVPGVKVKIPGPVSHSLNPEERLSQLKLVLPRVPQSKGNYIPAQQVGNLLYTAGHGPVLEDGINYTMGRLGKELTIEEGITAARNTGLAVLATLRHTLGSLNRVKRIIKTLGMVNGEPHLVNRLESVLVIDGFSSLMVEVFGPVAGTGPRSAVTVAMLPMNTPVEIEAIFEIY